ncbi:MAG: endoglucanase [Solirubrobacteraceae bacterium]|nr:endoglucanase [Solirubrobacteraceae bacterium]
MSAAVAAVLVLQPGSPRVASAGLVSSVAGNHLVDGRGHTIRLLGVNRSGTEYACAQGWGIFDSPHPSASDDARMIDAMKRWRINAVAIPLNEACWLGISGVKAKYGGSSYRRAIASDVRRYQAHGMRVVLRLATAAPGGAVNKGDAELPMADRDHAPAFWRSVARRFRKNRAVLFSVYDEPHDISWHCWRSGCRTSDSRYGEYQAAGVSELVQAIRSQGARQPILLGGLGYAGDLSGWLANAPEDPAHALVADFHTFESAPHTNDCPASCRRTVASVARHVPVVTGGFGEYDCNHDYVDSYMRWADRHGVSYLAWTWDTWGCRNGLVSDYYKATPTGFGVGVRDHLRRLAARRR